MEKNNKLKEVYSYCNALFVLIKNYLPICPAKNKLMWEKAIKEGNKLANERRQELLNELGNDIEDVLIQNEDNKDLPLRFMIEPADAHSIINYIKKWKPKKRKNKI